MSSSQSNHVPHLDLLPTDASGVAAMATHVAVRDGDWFDPTTWANGEVPGTGALVQIPEDVSVDYQGASDAELFIVRVDGALNVAAGNGTATKMVVDTILTAPGSAFRVAASSPTDGTVDIVFREGSPAAHHDSYTDLSAGDGVIGRHRWDPDQLSLGLVASGTVEVHGQEVDAGLTLAHGPAAGATVLTLEAAEGDPGWAVGQKIVVGGMDYAGRGADGRLATEDEVREIVAVSWSDGRLTVELDRPLEHDHRGPVDPATGAEITGLVGNLTRNVTFSSAVADLDGDGLADRGLSLGEAKGAQDHHVTERGHVMFMHNDDVGVTNAAFFGLGRTDKSVPVDDFVTAGEGNHRLHQDNGVPGQYDPGMDIALETPAEAMTNQRARYALHIHEAGTGGEDHGAHGHDAAGAGETGACPETGEAVCHCADQDGDGIENGADDDYFDGAYIQGNVVWGTPGWGIVQHSSKAFLGGNLVFDVAGAAYVAELGDETGRWEDNLAVGTYGSGRPGGGDESDFNEDGGHEGNGFYLKSRSIEVVENTAHSSAGAAFYYHNHGAAYADTHASGLGALAGIADGAERVATEDVPVRTFEGNAAFAAFQGIRIVTDPLDAVRKFNDAWSHLKDFTAVAVDESGVSLTYSSKYLFENFRIFGTGEKATAEAQQASAGFFFKASAADLTVLGGHVENFGNAVTNWSQVGDRQEYRRGYWDPKDPTADSPDTPRYDGMGAFEGIENPALNLWNTHVIGLDTRGIDGVRWRLPAMEVETAPGQTGRMRGGEVLGSPDHAPNAPGVEIELLGDSRGGALVALWREDLGDDPHGATMLGEAPLAYQESVYLSQIWFAGGQVARRSDWQDLEPGINADIWSGTVLEFAKTDSLGRQVFLYGDFSPLDPAAAERTVTTNERILFTKEMIDGVLVRDGYMRAPGAEDVRFVIMKMVFTDRLTGQLETKKFLVALDTAWEIPEGARDLGLLHAADDVIVAPEYRVFENGALVPGRAPIVPGDLAETPPAETPTGQDDSPSGDTEDDAPDDLTRPTPDPEPDPSEPVPGDPEPAEPTPATPVPESPLPATPAPVGLHFGFMRAWMLSGDRADFFAKHGMPAFQPVNHPTTPAPVAPAPANPEPVPEPTSPVPDELQPTPAGDGQDPVPDPAPTPPSPPPVPWTGAVATGPMRTWLMSGDRADFFAKAGSPHNTYGAPSQWQPAPTAPQTAPEVPSSPRPEPLTHPPAEDPATPAPEPMPVAPAPTPAPMYQPAGVSRAWLLSGDRADFFAKAAAYAPRVVPAPQPDRIESGEGGDRLTGGLGPDRFVFDERSGDDEITDFEHRADAIEFLIAGFRFDELEIRQDGEDTVLRHPGGSVRLTDTDADLLGAGHFEFLPG